MTQAETAKGRYQQLTTDRSPFLTRAWDCSALTIPSLLPRNSATSAAALLTPYQGMGARGVNNLASKLLLALLPPNQSFFRLRIDDQTLEELQGNADGRTKVEEGLARMEKVMLTEAETTTTRSPLFEALKQLIVTGNVLVYLQPEGGLKIYRLDKYVVKRDPAGNLLEVIVHECVHPETLPEDLRKVAAASVTGTQKTVDVYTWVRRKGGMYHVHQEVADKVVPRSKGKWPVDKLPLFALRWASIDGEDYGRGHVEEYIGDLRSLEGLMAAIVEGSAAAAKTIFLVNPNGSTQERTISDAPNLAVRSGVASDVSVLKVEKFNDFRVAHDTINMVEQRLAQAFLLTSSITRNAERVTAEEIRLMARELEDALGGVYSILAQEFQLPYVRRLMHQLTMQGKLPQLPPDTVKPSIVTGLDALGRGHDLQNILTFAQTVKAALGDEAFSATIKPTNFVTQVATALGIETKELVKTEEEVANETAAARRQAMIQQLGPEAMKAMAAQNQGNTNGSQAVQA
jgi:hypothetical protein